METTENLFLQYHASKKYNEAGELIHKNEKIRNELVMRNQRLIVFVINKFFPKVKIDREDLIQEGSFGLFDAVDRYNPNLGYRFSTFACWWIRQSCNLWLQNQSAKIVVPSHIRAKKNRLMKEHSLSPATLHELESHPNLTAKMLSAVKAASRDRIYISLSAPVHSDGINSANVESTIADDRLPNENQRIDSETVMVALNKALDSLSEKERNVLFWRLLPIE